MSLLPETTLPVIDIHEALGATAEHVRSVISRDITDGVVKPGERLGAERDLAVHYGVSRSTLRAALNALESHGVVRRVRGRTGGIFVSERKVERDLSELASLPAYLSRQGFTAGARVLATTMLEADAETADALGLPAGAFVYRIERVRLADGEPISLEQAQLPADRFPGLLDRPLGGSLYELLETEYGISPGKAEERIEVVGATSRETRVLGVPRSAPLVSVVRTAVDRQGLPFEYSHDLFRGDRVRIVVRTHGAAAAHASVASVVEVVDRHGL